MWRIALVVLVACGPSLQATGPRHVVIALDTHELYVTGCDDPCRRILLPGERVLRCDSQDFGWPKAPPPDPTRPPDPRLDLATLMERAVGFAVCKVGT